jgi:uncharacterized protein involved in exopolysaccharide biosynthesis
MMSERANMADMGEEGAIDMRALGRSIAARKWWIIIPTLAAVVATAAYVNMVRPRYTADAKVFLDNQESYYTRPDKVERDTSAPLDPEAVASQVQIVTSREVAREVIRELKLVGDAEFDPAVKGGGALSRLAILFGLQRDPTSLSPEDRILETYYARLQVFQVPKTRVLAIEFVSERPDLAARAANVIADQYIKLRSNVKKDDALKARDWLATTLQDLKPRVEAAHLAIARYREEHGLQRGSSERSTVNQELGDLVAKLADARTAQSEAQGKAALINRLLREGRIFEIPDVARDDLIRRISEQRVNLRAQLALELRTLLPGHPRVKELQSQVSELESELRAAAQKTARTLENDAALATSKIKFLDAEVQRRRSASGEGDEKDARLKLLEQDAASLDAQYQSAMSKFNEASSRESTNSTPPDVRLVSPATSPQLPTFPKKIPMLAIAFLGALLFTTALVVTRALLAAPPRAPRVASPTHELHADEAWPVAARFDPEPEASDIGEPPRINARAPVQNVQAAAVEPVLRRASQFDDVRRAMEALRQDGEAARVLVCGLTEEESAQGGIRLARALARSGRAILIDLGQNGAASAALGFGAQQLGLSDLAAGVASFAEVIHRDGGGRLHVLPIGGNHAEIHLDVLGDIFDALSETYDHLVLVAPPAAEAALQTDVLSAVDLAALVAPLETKQAEARRALEALQRTGVEAVVLDSSSGDRRGRLASSRDAA